MQYGQCSQCFQQKSILAEEILCITVCFSLTATQFPCYRQYIASNIVFLLSNPNSLHSYLPMAAALWLSGPGWSDPSWPWAWDIQTPTLRGVRGFQTYCSGLVGRQQDLLWDPQQITASPLGKLQVGKAGLATRMSVFIMFAEFWHKQTRKT